ncbi:MAG: SUMF1/EgtB/PvdO family nonheme iron enzyme [Bacteroidales bacterium]|nr:SUMF1/EgtB/PvdO family nonheme iron enzyme [Bacteroidales bacterium]
MKNRFNILPLLFVALILISGCEKDPVKPEDPQQTDKSSIDFNVNGVKFTMILVEHGSFVKGEMSNYFRNTPVVLTKDYYIGKYEVTQDLWEAVMGSEANPSAFKGGNLPVNNISWDDCIAFIDKLNELTGKNFRLPTECEWEFAARGGNNLEPYTFSGSNDVNEVAWYKDNSDNQVHAVGGKKANALKLYDMTGNAIEWVQNPFIEEYYKTDTLVDPNPTDANPKFRVLKGGCYYLEHGKLESLSVSANFAEVPTAREESLGFRLALTK